MELIETLSLDRVCEGCTECCTGELAGNIYGKEMWPNRPCFFVKEHGCGIYKNRPEHPCRSFSCQWLDNPTEIPEWLKPSESGAIIILDAERKLRLVQGSKKISSDALLWVIMYAAEKGMEFSYTTQGGHHYLDLSSLITPGERINETKKPEFHSNTKSLN